MRRAALLVAATLVAAPTLAEGQTLPDLRVDAFTPAQASGSAGTSFTATTTVTAADGASSGFWIRYALSADAVPSADDTVFGGKWIASLGAGKSTTVTFPANLPAIPPGAYTVFALVDADGGVAESDETNNALSGGTFTIVRPDLTVGGVAVSPGVVPAGGTITVTDTLTAAGGPSAGSNVWYYASTDDVPLNGNDTYLGARWNGALASGGSATGSKTLTLPPKLVGTYRIVAIADGPNVVAETDETNNAALGPQIVITPADLTVTSVGIAQAAPRAGSVVDVAATIASAGGAVGWSTVKFYASSDGIAGNADDVPLGSLGVPPIAMDASVVVTTSFALPNALVGDWRIVAVADDNKLVVESDETNNALVGGLFSVPPADLRVTAVTLTPAATSAGETVTITDTVSAAGGGTPWTYVEYYASTDGTWSADDIHIGCRWVPGLPDGGSSTESTLVTLPDGLAGGSYQIIAVVDAALTVPESDETNNVLAGDAFTVATPDLVVETLTVTPSIVPVGATATLSATVRSRGGGAGWFSVAFYLSQDAVAGNADDAALGEIWLDPLAKDATRTIEVSGIVPTGLAGGYHLVAVVDRCNDIKETDETNNALVGDLITVVPPDLIVGAVTVTPATVEAGGVVAVESTVISVGAATGSSVVKFFVSADDVIDAGDQYLGSRAIGALAADATSVGTTTFALPRDRTGTMRIIAVADGGNWIPESDETNNALASAPITVTPPDLTVTAVAIAPTTVQAGGTVTVTDTVRSTGGAAPSAWVYYYASPDDIAQNGNDIYLGSRSTGVIANGASVSGSKTLTLPTTLVGTFRVFAVVDEAGKIAESDDGNNVLLGNAFTVTPADLSITALALAPAGTSAGATVTITDVVQNQGGATRATSVKYYASRDDVAFNATETYLGQRSVPALAAGQASVGTTAVTLPANLTGTYWVIARVDPGNVVVESDETNDTFVGNPFVIDPPDLAMRSVSVAPGSIAVGGTLTVTDSVQALWGPTAATSVTFVLSMDPDYGNTDDVVIGARSVPALAVDQVSTGTTTLQVPPSLLGAYNVFAVVDRAGVIIERDETNDVALGNPVQIGLDVTPPQIVISGVASGDVRADAQVMVCVDVSDPNLATSSVQLDGVPFQGCTSAFLEGDHVLVVSADDTAGNHAERTVAFALDWHDPVVTIAAPPDGLVTNATQVVPVYSAVDAHLLDVMGWVDGEQLASGTPVVAERTYRLDVVAHDLAGHAGSAAVSFAIDRTAPSIVVGGIANGDVTALAVSPTVSVTDAHPGTHQVTLDDQAWSGGVVNAPGAHVLLVTATDAAGNPASKQVAFTIDRTAPVVVVESPSGPALTREASIQVVASATDEGSSVAEVRIAGAVVTRGADGLYRATVPLAEGENTIQIVARDAAGTPGYADVTAVRDSTPPTLELSSPVEGATLGSTAVLVAGRVIAGGPATVHVGATPVLVGPDGSFATTVTVGAGPQTITVIATDAAGNPWMGERHVVISTVTTPPPTLAVSEPLQDFVATVSSIRVSGVATGDAVLTVSVNGAGVGVGADGFFSTTVPLRAGANTITVVVQDGVGRTDQKTVTGTYRGSEAGGGALALSVDAPMDGLVTAQAAIAVSGRVSSGTPPYQVTVAGVTATMNGGYFTAEVQPGEGDHALVVRATDAAGQVATQQRTVSVDRTKPVLTVTRPASATLDVSESPYLFQGTVGDTHLAGVAVDGQPVVVLGGSFSSSVKLLPGVNDVVVTATDVAGNLESQTFHLTLSNVPPEVKIVAPYDGSEATTPIIKVRATVVATAALQGVTVGTGAATEVGGAWEADVPLALGEQVITVTATDVRGLSGSSSIRVRYSDPLKEPLRVSGVDPAEGSGGVRQDALVSVSFNKPCRPASLPGAFTLTGPQGPIPGSFYVAPGAQTVSFVASGPLPAGQRVVVKVDGVLAETGPDQGTAFTSDFTVAVPPAWVHGVVLDEQLVPLEGARVSIEGTSLSVVTGTDGNWTIFGAKRGAAVLRFEGGTRPDGVVMSTVRRKIFIEGDRNTEDARVILTPVDVMTADRIGNGAIHLGFAGRYAPLAIDAPAGSVFFENGQTTGTATITPLYRAFVPVPLDTNVAIGALWKMEPVGLRFTQPFAVTLPNETGIAEGRLAVILAYDPDRHMVTRVGLGRVQPGGKAIASVQPVRAGSLELFGVMPLDDGQAAAAELWLQGSTSGATGFVVPPPAPTVPLDVRELLHRFFLGAVGGTAWAEPGDYSPFGLIDGQPGPSGSWHVHGRVRTTYSVERTDLAVVRPGEVTDFEVTLDTTTNAYLLPIEFTVRAPERRDGSPLPIVKATLNATREGVNVTPPALGPAGGERVYQQWVSPPGQGQARLPATNAPAGDRWPVSVPLLLGKTRIELAGVVGADRTLTVFDATLVSTGDPIPGQPRKALLTVKKTYDPASSTDTLVSFFKGWRVEAFAANQSAGVTGEYGQFSFPVKHWGPNTDATVCTKVKLGDRYQPYRTESGGVEWYQQPSEYNLCTTAYSFFNIPGFHRSDLLVDMRIFTGGLRFRNRSGEVVAGAGEPGVQTAWRERGELESISAADAALTELHFFREDDLSAPIAKYAIGFPASTNGDHTACADPENAGSVAPHACYVRLRLGPADPNQRRNNQQCDSLGDPATLTGGARWFYDTMCRGKERMTRLRLNAGDGVVVFAVNHATGYSGMTRIVVPPISTNPELAQTGTCAADVAAGGPLVISDAWYGLEQAVISRCAKQEVRIKADVDLYPPEVDVRVARSMVEEPIFAPNGTPVGPVRRGVHLVRHGGMATSSDEFVQVSTHWRVRLKPDPRIDLAFDGQASVEPTQVTTQSGVTATDAVRASGGAAKDVSVTYYLSTSPTLGKEARFLARRRTGALAADQAGAPVQTKLPLPGGLAGAYFILGAIDAEWTIPEADKSNNVRVIGVVNVQPPPGFTPVAVSTMVPSRLVDPTPWTDPAAKPPGELLENYCSLLSLTKDPSILTRCAATEGALVDVPAGVPPIAGHVVKITGAAAEQPVVRGFRVPPGNATANVQTAFKYLARDTNTLRVISALPRANYYVHVVGHSLFANDANGNGQIEKAELEELAGGPPAFAGGADGVPGLPNRAIWLKDVYRSQEPDGQLVERFDRAREHEFRVADIKRESITVDGGIGGPRRLDDPDTAPQAQETDTRYTMLLSLLEPEGVGTGGVGRAGTLSGDYRVRLGADDFGLECDVKIAADRRAITGTCDGQYLLDVLSGRDLLFFELYLSGNGENVLYRFNFHGLMPSRQFVAFGTTVTRSVARTDDTASAPAPGRQVAEPAQLAFFVGPSDLRKGSLRVCADDDCTERGLLKSATLTFKDADGTYDVQETAGSVREPLSQLKSLGVDSARLFTVSIPQSCLELRGGNARDGGRSIILYLVDDARPDRPLRFDLGKPRLTFSGTHVSAPGQAQVGGVNLADGHLSFVEEDFSLPEYASVVRFARTYDNQDNGLGPVGIGWHHSYEGFVVEERLGQYTVVIDGQAHHFWNCASVDSVARTALGCRTDRSHEGTLGVTQAGALFQGADGTRYRFEKYAGAALRRELVGSQAAELKVADGRRRWLLTAYEDGHAVDPTYGNKQGWTQLAYVPDTENVATVARVGGKLEVAFEYEQESALSPRLASRLRLLGISLLKTVTVRFLDTQATIHRVELVHDLEATGNLTRVTRVTGDPAQRWDYTYESTASATSFEDRQLLANEIKQVDHSLQAAAGAWARQSTVKYERAATRAPLPYASKLEAISAVYLPGNGGAAFQIAYTADQSRTLTRPDGVVGELVLTPSGNIRTLRWGTELTQLQWDSETIGSAVFVNARSSRGAQIAQAPSTTRILTAQSATLSSGGGTAPVTGLAGANAQLWTAEPNARFGTIESRTVAAAAGQAQIRTPLSPTTGDALGVVVLDPANGGTLLSLSRDVDPLTGVVRQETDGAGRTKVYSGSNRWGLPEQATVTGPAAAGGRTTYTLTFSYDAYGRLTGTSDDLGHDSQVDRDAIGRVTRRFTKGPPNEEYLYAYTQSDGRLEVVETLTGTAHSRKTTYDDGRIVSEEVTYGTGQRATASWAWVGGRLDSHTDLYGTEHRPIYDSSGRMTGMTSTGLYGAPQQTNAVLDAQGRVTSVTSQSGTSTVTEHDALGRPARVAYANATDTRYVQRDQAGASTEHRFGPQINIRRDALGRARRTEGAAIAGRATGNGLSTVVEYDGAGRITRRSDDQRGLTETWGYDVLDRVTAYTRTAEGRTAPLVLDETRTYADAGGNTTVQIDRKVGTGGGTRNETSRYMVNARGLVLWREEPVGGKTARWDYEAYDARGNAWTERGPGGTIQRTFDSLGNLLSVTDADGVITRYGVSADGKVVSQDGPHEQERWTLSYDGAGHLYERVLAAAGTTPSATWRYEYKPNGDVVITDPAGVTHRTLDAAGRVATESRGGIDTTYTWDGSRVKSKVSHQVGSWTATETYDYDAAGRTLSRTETWDGPGFGYTYDDQTHWSGRTALFTTTWTVNGPARNRGPLSRSGTLQVDGLGNLVERVQAGAMDWWRYDALGLLAEEKLHDAPSRTLSYPATGGPVPTTERIGPDEWKYEYNELGLVLSVQEPSLRSRTMTWSGRGLLKSATYGRDISADGRYPADVWEYTYDGGGGLLTATHGTPATGGQVWTYDHGPRGELRRVTQPDGLGVFNYEHDAAARLTSVSPPSGGMPGQTFAYDELNRETRRTRGTAEWRTVWLGAHGTTTGPDGVRAKLLDPRGRIAQRTWSGGGTAPGLTQADYNYDGLDQLLDVAEQGTGAAPTTYGYDDLSRLTSVRRGTGPEVRYRYETTRWQLAEVSTGDLDPNKVVYDYDPVTYRVQTITGPAGTTTVQWEPGGERIEAVHDGSLYQRRCYDGVGRLREVLNATAQVSCDDRSAAIIAGFDIPRFDGRGNPLGTERFGQSGNETIQYGYDAADRLTGVLYGDHGELFDLAADGTRLGVKEASTLDVLANPTLLGRGGYASLIAPTSHRTYAYDPGTGGLAGITEQTTSTSVASYVLDGAGRPSVETRAGVGTRIYRWDAAGRLRTLETQAVPGAAIDTVTYGYDHAGLRVSKQGPSGAATWTWGGLGELVEETSAVAGAVRYTHLGQLAIAAGGSRLLHDPMGTVVGTTGTTETYRYDAWGAVRPGSVPGRTTGTTLAYAGQHWDHDAGLSYAQQRWYQPESGRFLSEDPVGWNADRQRQPTRAHPFGYAAGNPQLYTDPEGLDVGQPESTTRRAQEDVAYEGARNEWSKDEGNWLTGCLAGEADNWRHIDSAAFYARSKSPQWLAGYVKCHGRPVVDAWHDSDVAKTTREFWTATPRRAQAMGCLLGGGNGVLPVGDVSSLPEGMQSTAAACEFGVGAATAVVTLGEAGVGVWRGLKNMRPMPRPALAGVTAEGRTVAVAGDEASLSRSLAKPMEARALGEVSPAPGQSRVWPKHHPFPQYLGGVADQTLKKIPKKLHHRFHAALDRWKGGKYARSKGAEHFRGIDRETVISDLREFYEEAEGGVFKKYLSDFEQAVGESVE